MKKRVLQFIGSFHQGGSERQAVAVTRLLKRDGSYDVFAATLNNEGVLKEEIDAVGLAEIPEFPLTSFYDANFVRQVRRCAKYLRENKIDLVHTHDFYTNIFGMAASSLAGVRTRVASKRETGGMRSGMQEFVEKVAFGQARAIVVNSGAVRKHLMSRGVPTGKIKLIYNGLEIERFDETTTDRSTIRQRVGLPTGEDIRFVTLVANLRHAVKNVPMLLRSAKRVIAKHPNTHFVIAGEGELASELNELASQIGIAENVHLIGRCIDVPALLAASHVCVLTSTAEGFSNSILEYMAAGKPVVATNVGGASEAVIDGENGYLVASNNDQELADRLIELVEDEQKALKLGDEGKRVVTQKFSEKAQLQQTIELYNSVLNQV